MDTQLLWTNEWTALHVIADGERHRVRRVASVQDDGAGTVVLRCELWRSRWREVDVAIDEAGRARVVAWGVAF